MAEGIEITSGGAIAVDTDELLALIPRIADAARQLDTAADELRVLAASGSWFAARSPDGAATTLPLRVPDAGVERRLRERSERMRQTAASVRLMAEAYEIVEARARAEWHALAGVPVIGQAADPCAFVSPEALALADRFEEEWRETRFEGFTAQAWGAWPLGLSTVFVAWAMLSGYLWGAEAVGKGTVPPGRRLQGTPPAVRIEATTVEGVSAPRSTEDVVNRLPAGEAQVRVEAYDFADGHSEYFVHIAGTRDLTLWGDDPWNMESNLRLYFDEVSASYEAVRQSLEAAGARTGDIVHVGGHSQGAMVGAAVATEGEYEVHTFVSVGGPVTPHLPETTLAVILAHTDDAVAALAGGGVAAGVGAKGSMLVRRVGDPETGPQDLAVATHRTSRYAETARMLDESGDPRVEKLERLWAHLGEAESVRTIDVTATRSEVVAPAAPGRGDDAV